MMENLGSLGKYKDKLRPAEASQGHPCPTKASKSQPGSAKAGKFWEIFQI